MESKITPIKNFPKRIKTLLFFLFVLAFVFGFLVIALKIDIYKNCNLVAYCGPIRPTMSTEMMSTQAASQYKLAIEEINEGKSKSQSNDLNTLSVTPRKI
jgi:hypothetical protein